MLDVGDCSRPSTAEEGEGFLSVVSSNMAFLPPIARRTLNVLFAIVACLCFGNCRPAMLLQIGKFSTGVSPNIVQYGMYYLNFSSYMFTPEK